MKKNEAAEICYRNFSGKYTWQADNIYEYLLIINDAQLDCSVLVGNASTPARRVEQLTYGIKGTWVILKQRKD